MKDAGKGGRRLEVDDNGEEIEVFTPDQFRELFGVEPERHPGDDGFDQN